MSSKVNFYIYNRINMICIQSKVVREFMHLKQQIFFIPIQFKWVFMAVQDSQQIVLKILLHFAIKLMIITIKVLQY
jgi:hypothetical protein